jgi:hypothetical protein
LCLALAQSWGQDRECLGSPREDWSAVAECVTAAVALVAGGIAFSQLFEARRLRLAQAQPYVAAYLAESAVGPFLIDLVIRNFWTTAATEVTLDVTPELRRAAGGNPGEDQPVRLADTLPILAPGQEWRAFLGHDYGAPRSDAPGPIRGDRDVPGLARQGELRVEGDP